MKAFLIIVVLLLIGTAYLGGYLPQHRQLTRARNELQTATKQLADSQDETRMCRLENRLLGVIERATERNYGEAQRLSSEFFDQVRSEISQTSRESFKSTLESALQKRDAVTVDLTQGNPAILDLLQQILSGFRQTLGTTPESMGAHEAR